MNFIITISLLEASDYEFHFFIFSSNFNQISLYKLLFAKLVPFMSLFVSSNQSYNSNQILYRFDNIETLLQTNFSKRSLRLTRSESIAVLLLAT